MPLQIPAKYSSSLSYALRNKPLPANPCYINNIQMECELVTIALSFDVVYSIVILWHWINEINDSIICKWFTVPVYPFVSMFTKNKPLLGTSHTFDVLSPHLLHAFPNDDFFRHSCSHWNSPWLEKTVAQPRYFHKIRPSVQFIIFHNFRHQLSTCWMQIYLAGDCDLMLVSF